MEFYNATDKELSLYHDSLFHVGIAPANVTSFPVDGDFTRSANAWYRKIVGWIWEAEESWEFDDSNYATLPYAKSDLVAGQNDYALPSTAHTVKRVEVLDSNGDFYRLKQFDQKDVGGAISEWKETDTLPSHYDLIGNSIYIKSAPAAANVTLTKGLKVLFSRDVDQFTPADTTQQPGFKNTFHRLISLGAALDYANANEMDEKITILVASISEAKQELQNYYGKRNEERPVAMKVKDRSFI